MTVKLRFALKGPRHNRIFHLVAANKLKARDAKPIETLGIYDPQLKDGHEHKVVRWSVDRIKYWLRQGAEPSLSVVKLLTLGGILTPDSRYHQRFQALAQGREDSKSSSPSQPAKETA